MCTVLLRLSWTRSAAIHLALKIGTTSWWTTQPLPGKETEHRHSLSIYLEFSKQALVGKTLTHFLLHWYPSCHQSGCGTHLSPLIICSYVISTYSNAYGRLFKPAYSYMTICLQYIYRDDCLRYVTCSIERSYKHQFLELVPSNHRFLPNSVKQQFSQRISL